MMLLSSGGSRRVACSGGSGDHSRVSSSTGNDSRVPGGCGDRGGVPGRGGNRSGVSGSGGGRSSTRGTLLDGNAVTETACGGEGHQAEVLARPTGALRARWKLDRDLLRADVGGSLRAYRK